MEFTCAVIFCFLISILNCFLNFPLKFPNNLQFVLLLVRTEIMHCSTAKCIYLHINLFLFNPFIKNHTGFLALLGQFINAEIYKHVSQSKMQSANLSVRPETLIGTFSSLLNCASMFDFFFLFSMQYKNETSPRVCNWDLNKIPTQSECLV